MQETAGPAAPPPPGWPSPVPRRLLGIEAALVVAIALGVAAARSVLGFVGALTAGAPLAAQRALLNGTQAPGRPWLDLGFQLVSVAALLLPVALVAYLLAREGRSLADLGLWRRRSGRDLVWGLGLAALVGGSGLALYLAAYAAGAALTVVPTGLPDVWWRLPVLVLSALANAALEEVVLVGFLLTRLRQLGWSDNRAAVTSAAVRASYHLYQGLGGALGNAAMGLLFGRLYQRTGRLLPLVVAHATIDAVAFIGYTLLAGRVGWLPG